MIWTTVLMMRLKILETISTAKRFGIPVRWWWWTTVLMMRLKILETISTAKWFWSTTHINHFHSKMVLAFRYGDDDEWRCWWWDWRFRVWFVLFCFVCFIWGCRMQLCWDLCTVHKNFLMHHNRSQLFSKIILLKNVFYVENKVAIWLVFKENSFD